MRQWWWIDGGGGAAAARFVIEGIFAGAAAAVASRWRRREVGCTLLFEHGGLLLFTLLAVIQGLARLEQRGLQLVKVVERDLCNKREEMAC